MRAQTLPQWVWFTTLLPVLPPSHLINFLKGKHVTKIYSILRTKPFIAADLKFYFPQSKYLGFVKAERGKSWRKHQFLDSMLSGFFSAYNKTKTTMWPFYFFLILYLNRGPCICQTGVSLKSIMLFTVFSIIASNTETKILFSGMLHSFLWGFPPQFGNLMYMRQ